MAKCRYELEGWTVGRGLVREHREDWTDGCFVCPKWGQLMC